MSLNVNGRALVRRTLVAALAVVAVLFAAAGASRAAVAPSPWFQAGWNQGHTGFNPQETQLTSANAGGLTQAWHHSTPEPCCAAPETTSVVSANGIAYYVGGAADVHAVNATTGLPVWSAQAPECAFADSGPGLTLGILLVPTSECTPDDANSWLTAYDATTGALLWSLKQGNDMSSPLIFGGIAYVEAAAPGFFSPDRLIAVDVHTGTVLWHRALAGPTAALASDGTRLYTSTATQLIAVDPSTGQGEWSRSVPGGRLLVSKGHVIVAGVAHGQQLVKSFSPTGQRSWAVSTPGSAPVRISATSTELLVADTTGLMQARSLATGAATWSHRLPGGVLTQPAIAGGVIYATVALPQTSAVYALRDGSGAVLWQFTEPGSAFGADSTAAPSVAAGTLFASLGSGIVRAFQP